MNDIIERIAYCVEFGKIDEKSPYPPNMRGELGADELTRQAIEAGVDPDEILNKGMVVGMDKVGQKFSENKIFVPKMLMSAKAMSTAMEHIKPFFQAGTVQRKGKFVLGTVAGDLHDIGKNLVGMMVEGAGWEVIDLGVDVSAPKFIETIKENPGCAVGQQDDVAVIDDTAGISAHLSLPLHAVYGALGRQVAALHEVAQHSRGVYPAQASAFEHKGCLFAKWIKCGM